MEIMNQKSQHDHTFLQILQPMAPLLWWLREQPLQANTMQHYESDLSAVIYEHNGFIHANHKLYSSRHETSQQKRRAGDKRNGNETLTSTWINCFHYTAAVYTLHILQHLQRQTEPG